jgi:phospholipid/cholesterol/gamma-HCH transport system substrate-binding protein
LSATTELPGSGRLVSQRVVVLLGIVLSVLLVAAVLLVIASFGGTFRNEVDVQALLPAGANAPQVNSPVEYRDVTVGQVSSSGRPVGGGRVSITLRLEPDELGAIPRSVRATVGPLSIFGNQYVDLEAVDGTSGPALEAGEMIDAIPPGPSASLQSTVADFYDVLDSIHPAQLEATLTTIAGGLRGQGTALGQALQRASTYFDQMIPLLPTLESDLRLLSPVAKDLTASTPNLLAILHNLTTTGRTITADASQIHQLFSGGAAVTGQAADLLDNIATPFEHVLADSGPLLDDISQNPQELAQVLSGLDRWSKAWTAAESQGPYLSVSSTIDVPNPADLVLASVGAPDATALFADGLGAGKVNPSTYTSADCPTYGTAAGTDCGGAAGAPSSSETSPTVLTAGEQQAAVSVTSALDHDRTQGSPAVTSLLLGPLLENMAGAA